MSSIKLAKTKLITDKDFFHLPSSILWEKFEATIVAPTELIHFGWFSKKYNQIPSWHENILTNVISKNTKENWWRIPDFDPAIGDVKTVWELSRFDWVLDFTKKIKKGDKRSFFELNQWLTDWCVQNPTYKGINWKCGQEASIRVIHLAVSALILDQFQKPEAPLETLILAHLERIGPTIQYAIAQDNNHGTSEAAALFIGGSWLYNSGNGSGKKWMDIGRKWLENRAIHLIESDGSFSQYSINYHRLMLDTYSVVEVWRRKLLLPKFSPELYGRMDSATNWLYQMVQSESGEVPNLGANDGAKLIPISDTDYRDFRPTVQTATVIFRDKKAYDGNGSWNETLNLLEITIPEKNILAESSQHFENGGYFVLRNNLIFVLFRYPNFRFRPSQADALHLDLWNGGNILRDAGTYSYNTNKSNISYFSGTKGHNTIQFDDRDQMPRLGRFLFGAWLKPRNVDYLNDFGKPMKASAGYIDYCGAVHERSIELSTEKLTVIDQITGFKNKAVLRWRLLPGNWVLEGNSISNSGHILSIQTELDICRLEIVEGWESRYYLNKTLVPVLELEVIQQGQITTTYQYNS